MTWPDFLSSEQWRIQDLVWAHRFLWSKTQGAAGDLGNRVKNLGKFSYLHSGQRKWPGICLSRPYPFNFLKRCLPQIFFGLFLNTVSHYCHTYLHTWKCLENVKINTRYATYATHRKHQLKIGSKNRLKYDMKTVLIVFKKQQKYCEVMFCNAL